MIILVGRIAVIGILVGQFLEQAFEPCSIGIFGIDFTAGHLAPACEFLGFVVASAVFHDVQVVVGGVHRRDLLLRQTRHINIFTHADVFTIDNRVALTVFHLLTRGENQCQNGKCYNENPFFHDMLQKYK